MKKGIMLPVNYSIVQIRQVLNICNYGIHKLESSNEDTIEFGTKYNIILRDNDMFRTVKYAFKENGYNLLCFSPSGYGNPNGDFDYELTQL